MRAILVIALTFGAGLTILLTAEALGPLVPSPVFINGQPAGEGAVVGQGTPLTDREGCHFSEPVGWSIRVGPDDPNKGYVVTSALSEACELTIASITPSVGPNGAIGFIVPSNAEISEERAPPPEEPKSSGEAFTDTWYGPKKVNMRYWTHGACPACTWDMLTEVYDSITFSWTNAPEYQARIDSYYAGCKWSSGTGWYKDRCAYESWDFGPTHPRAFIKNAGDFHWTSNWAYTHTLRQELWGDYVGAWGCTGWVTGSYVYGPAQNCWQD